MVEPQDLGSPQRWTDECSGSSRFTARLLVGGAMLGLGALWTMDNLEIADASEITRWWPVLLMVFGVAKVLGWGTQRSALAGALWLVAGGWLQLHELGIVHTGFAGLWPLALIIIGARFIFFPARSRGRFRVAHNFAEGTDLGGRIKMDVVMSNAQRRAEPGPFKGGEVASVLATAQLDLRGATLAEGRVELEANAVLGGIELFVPRDWRVVNAVTLVLGTVEDHTEKMPEGTAPRGTLYVKGAVVMGGIEIRN